MLQGSKFKYGLVAVDFDGNVVHYCGYEEPITLEDKDDLIKELFIDSEFGMVGNMNYVLLEATEDIVNYFILNSPEFNEE